ncbi:hypothetical protein KGO95_00445 [Patescibacteria group bacterium]|nr:hypothetical protein [Patescibacteria group bacterium]
MEIIGLFFMLIFVVAAAIVGAVLAVLLAALVLQALWFIFWTHLITTLTIIAGLFACVVVVFVIDEIQRKARDKALEKEYLAKKAHP